MESQWRSIAHPYYEAVTAMSDQNTKKTFEVKLYNLNSQEQLIDMVSMKPSYLPYIMRSFEVKSSSLKDGKLKEINNSIDDSFSTFEGSDWCLTD